MKICSIQLPLFFAIMCVGSANVIRTSPLRRRTEEESPCDLYTGEEAGGICNAYYKQGCVENPTKVSCGELEKNFKKITDRSIPGSIPCETSLSSCPCFETFEGYYDILSQLDEDSCTWVFGLAINTPILSAVEVEGGFTSCNTGASSIATTSFGSFGGLCNKYVDQSGTTSGFPPLTFAEVTACAEVLQCYSDFFELEECIPEGDCF